MFKKFTLVFCLLLVLQVSAQTANTNALIKMLNTSQSSEKVDLSVTDAKSNSKSTSSSSDVMEKAATAIREKLARAEKSTSTQLSQPKTVDFNRSRNSLKLGEKWTVGTVKSTAKKSKSSILSKSLFDSFAGTYIEKDYVTDGTISYNSAELGVVNDTTFSVTDFWGIKGATIKATINMKNGTITVAPQKLYTHATYGDVYIYAINNANKTYSTTDPIPVTINIDGTASLGSWGAFVASGEYQGSCFQSLNKSDFIRANATITNVTADSTETYGALIEQPFANEISIINFANNGVAVKATLRNNKEVRISPQFIFSNSLYGSFFCAPADWATSQSALEGAIIGTGTENTITLGNWGVFCRTQGSLCALHCNSTTITLTNPISYPAEVKTDFDGDGTSANPYKIKDFNDLISLSLRVEDGESFTGKYLDLTTDINAKSVLYRLAPIGSTTAKFNGTFRGNNHAIDSLSYNTGDNYIGLFGYLDQNAVVKDLNISTTVKAAGSYIGGIAGVNYGTISNCKVSGNFSTTSLIVGGVVGETFGYVENCSFNGNISGYGDVGGVAGSNRSIVTKCSAYGNISMVGYINSLHRAIGGVVASQVAGNNTSCKVSTSYFCGSIVDNYGYGYVAGVVGEALGGTIEKSFSVATLQSSTNDNAGGSLAGVVGLTLYAHVNDCYSASTIVNTDVSESIGGVVGIVMKGVQLSDDPVEKSSFSNCYSTGMINGGTSVEKAIYGSTAYDDIFTNCYFDSQATGLKSTIGAKTTAELTASSLDGFDSSIWMMTAGMYPRIRSIEDNDAAYLSAAPLALANGETTRKVKTNFTVGTANGIVWKVYNNPTFANESNGLTISGSNVTLKGVFSTEMLVAFDSSNNFMKIYRLALVPKIFDGDGTEASPYLIKNKLDFKKLNEATSTYLQPYEGDFFKMANDIDCESDTTFAGVAADGVTSHVFAGSFDGDGHSIKNLIIRTAKKDAGGKYTTTGSSIYSGLFGICAPESTIKNVTIDKSCIFEFYGYSAPIVGYTDGKVINCRNYSSPICAHQYIGGIAGVAGETALIKDCYNAGDVTSGYQTAGGIIGYNNGEIESCQNDGIVKADFINAYHAKGTQNSVGGIAGFNYGSINNACNNGEVYSYLRVGGVVSGNSSIYDKGNVTNSVNNGLVVCVNNDMNKGGIIGTLAGAKVINNNYYDAQINTCGGAGNSKISGINGMLTKDLVSGTALPSLSTDVWSFAANSYPVLKSFINEPLTKGLRSAYVIFADDENRDNLKTSATLSTTTCYVLSGQNFFIESNKLTVIKPAENIVVSDTIQFAEEQGFKVIPVVSIPDILKGSGSEVAPFLIENAADMNKLSEFMATSKYEYANTYFKVTDNLDFTGLPFLPVAVGAVRFQGNFDGNGKSISNIAFSSAASTDKYIGLFGNVGELGNIHNLTLDANNAIGAYSYVGGFAGRLYGTIDNCVNKATISATKSNYVGGLVAEAYAGANIRNCTNEGALSAYGSSSYVGGIVASLKAGATVENCVNKANLDLGTSKSYAAGIAATSGGNIFYCSNEGTIAGKQTIGGIVASGLASDSIQNCINKAAISAATSGTVGGIVATTANKALAWVINCDNIAPISGAGTVGGIVGKSAAGNSIINCHNTGAVTSSKSNCGGITSSFSGYTGYTSYLRDSYNTGTVTSTSGTYTGGVVGTISSDGIIDNCYNAAEVIAAGNFTGGFAGGCSSTVTNCYNIGNVSSTGYGVGGFSGIGSGEVSECYNAGNVTSTGGTNTGRFGNAGGFWGYGKPQLTNCYNVGIVSAPDFIGGFIGIPFDGMSMVNCYNGGVILPTGEATNCGNIVMDYTDLDVNAENVYFDKDINPSIKANTDTIATGKTTLEMTNNAIGTEFVNLPGCYPVLNNFAENDTALFYVATVCPDIDNTLLNITKDFTIGTPDCVTWTSSSNLSINGNSVRPTEVGAATLTATYGSLTKIYNLMVNATSGVDGVNTGKECIEAIYYDLNGRQIENPDANGFYIVKKTYSDGTQSTEKIALRK